MSCTNKWSKKSAEKFVKDYKLDGVSEDLALRTYSARLLGSDPELVLHGGGNTSVKSFTKDLLGNNISVLHVKGSGWDLATIEPQGHPAVKLEPLLQLKNLSELSDENMVAVQDRIYLIQNPQILQLKLCYMPLSLINLLTILIRWLCLL